MPDDFHGTVNEMPEVPESGSDRDEASPADDIGTTRSDEMPRIAADDDAMVLHPLAQDVLFHPTKWNLWPAVAILRWLLRPSAGQRRGLVFRSRPSLAFAASDIHDVALGTDSIDLTLTAPGIASPGSPLPTSDIARIIADLHSPGRGAIAAWLDGPGDRFMQVLESAQTRYNTAFSLATGGRLDSLHRVAGLAGYSAPLHALPGHRLFGKLRAEPAGAAGLAAHFIAAPSAVGLAAVVSAFTDLTAEVTEFAGARVRILRPARLGAPMMRMLGRHCTMPAAGAEVIVKGGSRESALRWARDRHRKESLRLLVERYIGSGSISVRLFLELDPQNIDPCRLGESSLGGMAVLGCPSGPTRLPLLDRQDGNGRVFRSSPLRGPIP